MDPAPRPGDIPPPQLRRPPGERYRVEPPAVRERPDIARALAMALGVGLVVAVVAALLRSILDVTVGLLALAMVGGWVVGAAVRRGAWGGEPHRASSAPELLGLALGALTWVVALVLAWVVALAILPGSERSLPERLSATPLLDWLTPQVPLVDLACLLLAAVLGWAGARSRATTSA